MQRSTSLIVAICLIFTGISKSQMTSNNGFSLESLYNNDSIENSDTESEFDLSDKNIPECELPTGISISDKKGSIIINWENPNNDVFEISVKKTFSLRSDDIVKSNKSSVEIKNVSRSEIDHIYLRRVCNDYGKMIYSEWVEVLQSSNGPCQFEDCENILNWFTYSVETQSTSTTSGIKKQWRIVAPPEFQYIEIEVEGFKIDFKNGGGYQSTGVYSKLVHLSFGEYEVIDIPFEVTYVRFKNIKYKKFGGYTQTCENYYGTALDQNSNCGQNFFYTVEEESNGSNTYNFYLISPQNSSSTNSTENLNSANIVLSNGQTEEIPLVGCSTNSNIIHTGQYNSCMGFTFGTTSCMLFPVHNDCENNNSVEINCDDFNFEISSSPFKIIEQNNSENEGTKCYFNWNFTSPIFNGTAVKLGGGDSYKIAGKSGLLLLNPGSYVVNYDYYDTNNDMVECDRLIEVFCDGTVDPDISDDEINSIIPCDLVGFEYEDIQYYQGEILNCNLTWNTPDSVSVMLTAESAESATSISYGANNGALILGDAEWEIRYVISYNHPDLGWISNECSGIFASCPSNNDNIDTDGDGILDDEDNCPFIHNPDQTDTDEDGIGDLCEPDTDGDGVIDDYDNCVYTVNPDQEDINNNNTGDICEDDNDSDDDGIPNKIDNCPFVSNTDQLDTDGDGIGDLCEPDTDDDGVIDDEDNCWLIANTDQLDTDGDNIGDVCDNSIENDNDVELDETFICGFLSNFEGFFVDDQTVIFRVSEAFFADLNGDHPDFEAINTQLSLLKEINVTVTYINASGQQVELKNIYTKDAIDTDLFDFYNVSFYIESNSPVNSNLSYRIEALSIDDIEILCDPIGLTLEEESTPEDEDIETTEIPNLSCGETFTTPEDSSIESLDELEVGHIIYLGGFPLVVTEVTKSKSPFSGKAMIPMPFGDQEALIVPLTDLEINKDFFVTQGNVHIKATADQLQDINVVNVPVLSIGNNYCKPPEEVSTSSGTGTTNAPNNDSSNDGGHFDNNGDHTGTGTPYDWNGFDVNGMHFTGNPYNEWGCTAKGVVYGSDPEEDCDPSQPYSDIIKIINDLEPQLNTKIITAIEDLLEDLDIDLDNLDCGPIRDNLIQAFGNYSESLTDPEDVQILRNNIFGKNDIFLVDGMSKNFQGALSLPPDDNTKDENLESIEKYHVDLYLCDSDKEKFSDYNEALNSQEVRDKIKEYIINEISTWTEYEVKELFNPDNDDLFIPWLTGMIGKYFKEKYPDGGLGYIDIEDYEAEMMKIENKVYQALDFNSSSFFASASMEFMDFNIDDHQREIFDFEFDQGFKEVLGVNRAFFLEEIATINGESSGLLPMKIPTPMNGKVVDLYLDDLQLTTELVSVDVYAIIETRDGKLVLQADDVVITSSGVESAVLKLLSPVELKLFNPAKILIEAEKTSLTWSCEGLDNFQIEAQVEICDRYIKPYNLETKSVIEGENVTFDIQAGGSGWMEFHTTVNSSHPFVVTNYESWVFELQTLVIDTDSEYTPEFNPMKGYTSNFLVGDPNSDDPKTLGPGWKGFYLEKLLISLPEKIKNGAQVSGIVFNNVLFDDQGATGEMTVVGDILPNTNAGGWGISVDELSIAVMKNNIAGFGLKGDIETPLFEDPMRYEGAMHADDSYSLVVKQDIENPKNVPLFLAEAKISSIEFNASSTPEDEHLKLQATITGTLEVKGEELTSKLSNLPTMEFTNLTIRNFGEKKLEVQSWKMIFKDDADPINLFGMELGFGNEIGQSTSFNVKTDYEDEPNKVGIPMNVSLTFLKDLGVTMAGSFDVVGVLDEGELLHKWKYQGLEMNKFCADGSFSSVTIKNACLEWYDEESYGKGFRGTGGLALDFGPLNFEVEMIAEFGEKNGNKYFFLDALSKFEPFAVAYPLGISGFGGGVSYGMSSDFDPSSSIFTSIENTDSGIGTTFSGGTYTPNSSLGLSVKALVLFEMMHVSEVFNGSAFLSVTLKQTGGIDNIQFAGQANMLSEISLGDIPIMGNAFQKLEDFKLAEATGNLTQELDKLNNKPIGAVINGYVHLKLDFTNSVFTGDYKVFMDAAGVLEGAAPDKSVVNAKFRFAGPKDWYINIGTPQNLCGVKLDALVAEAKLYAYFDVGTTIPTFTNDHLPEKIRSFVQKNVTISEVFRKSGGGIMFGMGLDINIHASIWIGSLDVSCGAGFDVMMRKTDATCLGSNNKVGIDGWYAMGQLWAYVDAGLSIAGIEVLGVGLYAVLNAQFPDPTYLQAAVKVRLKLLFIPVNKTLKLEIGEPCVLEYANPDDAVGMDVISLITPFDGSSEILTDENVEVNYVLEVEKEYSVEEGKTYEITNIVYEFEDDEGNAVLFGDELNHEGNIETIKPHDLLKGNTHYTFTTTVDIIVRVDGQIVDEVSQSKSTEFTTSDDYGEIPYSNIDYAYPTPGMYNFYLKEKISYDDDSDILDMINNGTMHTEVTECYIKLHKGQVNLIEQFAQDYHKVVALHTKEHSSLYRKFEYNALKKEITFTIPTNIPADINYHLELLLMSDEGIEELKNLGLSLQSGIGSENLNNELLGHEVEFIETSRLEKKILILNYSFRVSEFDSFSKKMQAGTQSSSYTGYALNIVHELENGHIDLHELHGIGEWNPAVYFEIEDQVWEETYENVFAPFNKFKNDPKIISGTSLIQDFNQASFINPFSVKDISSEDLYIDDLLSSNSVGIQRFILDHDKKSLTAFFNFSNSLKQKWNPIISQANYSSQSSCGDFDLDNANFIDCVIDLAPYEYRDFLHTFKHINKTEYPYWNDSADRTLSVQMTYTMPNGSSGSIYKFTYSTPNE